MKKSILNTIIAIGSSLLPLQAATVVISNGLGSTNTQGITLEIGTDHSQLLNSSDYYVGVGRYVGDTFTPWTSLALDSGSGSPSREVTGSFATTSGGAFDGLNIHVFVGVLSSVSPGSLGTAFTPTGTQWAVFRPSTAVNFPVSSGATSQTVAFSSPASLTIVANGSASNAFNGNNFGQPSGTSNNVTNYFSFAAPVPETSTSLLGALGALALLRRRRN